MEHNLVSSRARAAPTDRRGAKIKARLARCFRDVDKETLHTFLRSSRFERALRDFLDRPDAECLLIAKGRLAAADGGPAQMTLDATTSPSLPALWFAREQASFDFATTRTPTAGDTLQLTATFADPTPPAAPPAATSGGGGSGESASLGADSGAVYFLKMRSGPVQAEHMDENFFFGQLGDDPLEMFDVAADAAAAAADAPATSVAPLVHFGRLTEEIYLPLLTNGANSAVYGDAVAKDVLESASAFISGLQATVGSSLGQVRLPMPPDIDYTSEAALAESRAELVHVLEGCVIRWSNLLRNLLADDPGDELMADFNATEAIGAPKAGPGMLSELRFWAAREEQVSSIFEQLQAPRIRQVLEFLDRARSTYNAPFAALCREVASAMAEAKDNIKYLQPMQLWAHRLDGASTVHPSVDLVRQCGGTGVVEGGDPELLADTALVNHIADPSAHERALNCVAPIMFPLMRTMLLIWKHSHYYKSPIRLAIAARKICNSMITRCAAALLEGRLCELILDDFEGGGGLKRAAAAAALMVVQPGAAAADEEEEEDLSAVKLLERRIRLCGVLKSAYLSHRDRSYSETPRRPWTCPRSMLATMSTSKRGQRGIVELMQTMKIRLPQQESKILATAISAKRAKSRASTHDGARRKPGKVKADEDEDGGDLLEDGVFRRIDLFIARLHDLLQIAATARQFVNVADVVAAGATLGDGLADGSLELRSTLAMHAVGAGGGPLAGPRGSSLGASFAQCIFDCRTALRAFADPEGGTKAGAGDAVATARRAANVAASTASWDPLNAPAVQFDQRFWAFRRTIRGLESRVVVILQSALDEGVANPTLSGKLAVLQAFAPLLNRVNIASAMEEQINAVLLHAGRELVSVEQSFELCTSQDRSRAEDPPDGVAPLPPDNEDASKPWQWMPSSARLLVTCRALRERLQYPIDALRNLAEKQSDNLARVLAPHGASGHGVFKSAAAESLIKRFVSLSLQIDEFEQRRINELAIALIRGFEVTAAQLKRPLLTLVQPPRDGEFGVKPAAEDDGAENQNAGPLRAELAVNFSVEMADLQLEAHYVRELHGIVADRLPAESREALQTLIERSEQVRRHREALTVLVWQYNHLNRTLLPVEAPLLVDQMSEMEAAMKPALGELRWQSAGVDAFLTNVHGHIVTAVAAAAALRASIVTARQIVFGWVTSTKEMNGGWRSKSGAASASASRDDNASSSDSTEAIRPYADLPMTHPHVWRQRHADRQAALHKLLLGGGTDLQRLLESARARLAVSSALPPWKDFVQYVQGVVVEGLGQVVAEELRTFTASLTTSTPTIEVVCELTSTMENGVTVKVAAATPSLSSRHNENEDDVGSQNEAEPDEYAVPEEEHFFVTEMPSLEELVTEVTDRALFCGRCFPRFDRPTVGDYVKELSEFPAVRSLLSSIRHKLLASREVAEHHRHKFDRFHSFWSKDVHVDAHSAMHAKEQRFSNHVTDGRAAPLALTAAAAPRLRRFAELFRSLRECRVSIAETRSIVNTGFVRMNAQPIKQSLATIATNHQLLLSRYMREHVHAEIERMTTIARIIYAELTKPRDDEAFIDDGILSPEEEHALRSDLSFIADVRLLLDGDAGDEIRSIIAVPPMSECVDDVVKVVSLLEQLGVPMNDEKDSITALNTLWGTVINEAFVLQETLRPQHITLGETTRMRAADMLQQIPTFLRNIHDSAPHFAEAWAIRFVIGFDAVAAAAETDALGRISESLDRVAEFAVEARRLESVACMLGIQEQLAAEMPLFWRIMPTLRAHRRLLRRLMHVWKDCKSWRVLLADWRRLKWSSGGSDPKTISRRVARLQANLQTYTHGKGERASDDLSDDEDRTGAGAWSRSDVIDMALSSLASLNRGRARVEPFEKSHTLGGAAFRFVDTEGSGTIVALLKQSLLSVVRAVPLIEPLRTMSMNHVLKLRHWRALAQLRQVSDEDDVTLPTVEQVPAHVNDVLRLELWDAEDAVRKIIAQASLETDIGLELDAIEAAWEDLPLKTTEKLRAKRFQPTAKDFERFRKLKLKGFKRKVKIAVLMLKKPASSTTPNDSDNAEGGASAAEKIDAGLAPASSASSKSSKDALDDRSGPQNCLVLNVEEAENLIPLMRKHQAKLQQLVHRANADDEAAAGEMFLTALLRCQHRIGNAEELLHESCALQKKWDMVEKLLTGMPDERRQMPPSALLAFEDATDEMQAFLELAVREPFPLALAEVSDGAANAAVRRATVLLEKSNAGLVTLLRAKRDSYPRLWMVDDAQLLSLLSLKAGHRFDVPTSSLSCIFRGLHSLAFEDKTTASTKSGSPKGKSSSSSIPTILAAIGVGCENLSLMPPLELRPKRTKATTSKRDKKSKAMPLEDWLQLLESALDETLKGHMQVALSTCMNWETDVPREAWLLQYPAQIGLTVAQVMWTDNVENAISSACIGNDTGALRRVEEVLAGRTAALVTALRSGQPPENVVKMTSLLTIDLHGRDVLKRLLAAFHAQLHAPSKSSTSAAVEGKGPTAAYGAEASFPLNDEEATLPKMAVRSADVWGMLWVPFLRCYRVSGDGGRDAVDQDAADASITAMLAKPSTGGQAVDVDDDVSVAGSDRGGDGDGAIEIRMAGWKTSYGFEYVGCSPRVVMTPLTERCMAGIALALRSAKSPFIVGPSGAAGAALMRQLADASAQQYHVVDCACSDNGRHRSGAMRSLGGVFRAIRSMAARGGWVALESVDLLPRRALELLALTLRELLGAIRARAESFNMRGETIALLDSGVGMGVLCTSLDSCLQQCATVPAAALPAELRALSRPCGLLPPSVKHVAMQLLLAHGVVLSGNLDKAELFASKLDAFCTLASDVFDERSTRHVYDPIEGDSACVDSRGRGFHVTMRDLKEVCIYAAGVIDQFGAKVERTIETVGDHATQTALRFALRAVCSSHCPLGVQRTAFYSLVDDCFPPPAELFIPALPDDFIDAVEGGEKSDGTAAATTTTTTAPASTAVAAGGGGEDHDIDDPGSFIDAEETGAIAPPSSSLDSEEADLERLDIEAVSACAELGFAPTDELVSNIIQLRQMFEHRRSVLLLGPSLSGKTTLWKAFAASFGTVATTPFPSEAIGGDPSSASGGGMSLDEGGAHETKLQEQRSREVPACTAEVINPAVLAYDDLFGSAVGTRGNFGWHEGVLSTMLKRMSTSSTPYVKAQRKLLVLDGPMSGGLDDAPNGEHHIGGGGGRYMDTLLAMLGNSWDGNVGDSPFGQDAMFDGVGSDAMHRPRSLNVLNTGDRIDLTSSMRLVFEATSLEHASPATISRMSIFHIAAHADRAGPATQSILRRGHSTFAPNVSVGDTTQGGASRGPGANGLRSTCGVNWQALVSCWLAGDQFAHSGATGFTSGGITGTSRGSVSERRRLMALFEKYVNTSFELLRMTGLRPFVKSLASLPFSSLVQMMLQHTCTLYSLIKVETTALPPSQGHTHQKKCFRAALLWAITGGMSRDDAVRFYAKWSTLFPSLAEEECIDEDGPEAVTPLIACLQAVGVDIATARTTLDSGRGLTVPTIEGTALNWLILALTRGRIPTMMVGPRFSGKSTLMSSSLESLISSGDVTGMTTLHCDVATDARSIQRVFEGRLTRRAGGRLGPSGNSVSAAPLLFFVEDLQLGVCDSSNGTARSADELLRQWVEYGFWYIRPSLAGMWKSEDSDNGPHPNDLLNSETAGRNTIVDAMFTVTLSSQASWSVVSPRVARHFINLAVDTPQESSMRHVFSTLIEPAWPRQSRAQTRAASVMTSRSAMQSRAGGAGGKLSALGMGEIDRISAASVDLIIGMTKQFPTTSSKPHYTWGFAELQDLASGLSLGLESAQGQERAKRLAAAAHEMFARRAPSRKSVRGRSSSPIKRGNGKREVDLNKSVARRLWYEGATLSASVRHLGQMRAGDSVISMSEADAAADAKRFKFDTETLDRWLSFIAADSSDDSATSALDLVVTWDEIEATGGLGMIGVLRLWWHEVLRVCCDRLVNDAVVDTSTKGPIPIGMEHGMLRINVHDSIEGLDKKVPQMSQQKQSTITEATRLREMLFEVTKKHWSDFLSPQATKLLTQEPLCFVPQALLPDQLDTAISAVCQQGTTAPFAEMGGDGGAASLTASAHLDAPPADLLKYLPVPAGDAGRVVLTRLIHQRSDDFSEFEAIKSGRPAGESFAADASAAAEAGAWEAWRLLPRRSAELLSQLTRHLTISSTATTRPNVVLLGCSSGAESTRFCEFACYCAKLNTTRVLSNEDLMGHLRTVLNEVAVSSGGAAEHVKQSVFIINVCDFTEIDDAMTLLRSVSRLMCGMSVEGIFTGDHANATTTRNAGDDAPKQERIETAHYDTERSRLGSILHSSQFLSVAEQAGVRNDYDTLSAYLWKHVIPQRVRFVVCLPRLKLLPLHLDTVNVESARIEAARDLSTSRNVLPPFCELCTLFPGLTRGCNILTAITVDKAALVEASTKLIGAAQVLFDESGISESKGDNDGSAAEGDDDANAVRAAAAAAAAAAADTDFEHMEDRAVMTRRGEEIRENAAHHLAFLFTSLREAADSKAAQSRNMISGATTTALSTAPAPTLQTLVALARCFLRLLRQRRGWLASELRVCSDALSAVQLSETLILDLRGAVQACGMDVKKKQKRLNATVAQMGDGRSVQDELSANVETSKALVSAATSEVAAAEEQSRREIHGMDIHAQTQIDVTTTLSRAMISQVRGLTPATVPLSVVRIASSMLLLMFPDQVRVAEDAMAKLAVPDEVEGKESDIDPLLEKALVDWEVCRRIMAKFDVLKAALNSFDARAEPSVDVAQRVWILAGVLVGAKDVISAKHGKKGGSSKKKAKSGKKGKGGNVGLTPQDLRRTGGGSAAAIFSEWLTAVLQQRKMMEVARPLLARLEGKLRPALKISKESLETAKLAIEAANSRQASLRRDFLQASHALSFAQDEVIAARKRLALVQRVGTAIGAEERGVWKARQAHLRSTGMTVAGDCLLAAAFATLGGSFDCGDGIASSMLRPDMPGHIDADSLMYCSASALLSAGWTIGPREKVWREEWLPDLIMRGIAVSESVDPLDTLLSKRQQLLIIRSAKKCNVALSERQALECAAMVFHATQDAPALLLDPHVQVVVWLRALLRDAKGLGADAAPSAVCSTLSLSNAPSTADILERHHTAPDRLGNEWSETVDLAIAGAVLDGATLVITDIVRDELRGASELECGVGGTSNTMQSLLQQLRVRMCKQGEVPRAAWTTGLTIPSLIFVAHESHASSAAVQWWTAGRATPVHCGVTRRGVERALEIKISQLTLPEAYAEVNSLADAVVELKLERVLVRERLLRLVQTAGDQINQFQPAGSPSASPSASPRGDRGRDRGGGDPVRSSKELEAAMETLVDSIEDVATRASLIGGEVDEMFENETNARYGRTAALAKAKLSDSQKKAKEEKVRLLSRCIFTASDCAIMFRLVDRLAGAPTPAMASVGRSDPQYYATAARLRSVYFGSFFMRCVEISMKSVRVSADAAPSPAAKIFSWISRGLVSGQRRVAFLNAFALERIRTSLIAPDMKAFMRNPAAEEEEEEDEVEQGGGAGLAGLGEDENNPNEVGYAPELHHFLVAMLPRILSDVEAAEALAVLETGDGGAHGAALGSKELSYLPVNVQAAALALSRLYVRPPPAEVEEILTERTERREALEKEELLIAQGLAQRVEPDPDAEEEPPIETGPPNSNVFASLIDDLASPATGLKAWVTDASPESVKMPMSWRELESLPFLKFLLVATLRPNRIIFASRQLLEMIVPNALDMLIADGRMSAATLIHKATETALLTSMEKLEERSAMSATNVPRPPKVLPVLFLLDPMEERGDSCGWSEPNGLDSVALAAVLRRQACVKSIDLLEEWPQRSAFASKGVTSDSELETSMALNTAVSGGKWLLMQNVHRASKQWLSDLATKLRFLEQTWETRANGGDLTTSEKASRRTCRLMLSASPKHIGLHLPRSLLWRCEVVSVGSALGLGEGQGLRPTLHGTWSSLSPEAWTKQLGAGGGGTVLEGDGDGSCSMADGLDHEGHRLLYGIALIHATFRERNAAFGAYAGGEGLAGWGRRGFLAAVESVRKACLGLGSTTTSTEVKIVGEAMGLLRYSIGEALFGGRLLTADGVERRLLRTLMALVMRPKTLLQVAPVAPDSRSTGGDRGQEVMFFADARDHGLVSPPPSLRLPNPNSTVLQGSTGSGWWRQWSDYITLLLPPPCDGTPLELQLPLSAEANVGFKSRRGCVSLAAAGALSSVTPRLRGNERAFSERCWEGVGGGGVMTEDGGYGEEAEEEQKAGPASVWSSGDTLEASVALLMDHYDVPNGWLWLEATAEYGAGGMVATMAYRDVESLVDEQLSLANQVSKRSAATPSLWSNEMGPWGFVWRQETVAMQELSRTVRRDLYDIDAALAGSRCLAAPQRATAAALRKGEVPRAWIQLSGPSLRTLPEWADRQQKRFMQIRLVHGAMSSKRHKGRGGSRSVADDLPSIAPPAPLVTWLPGLFSPRRFVAALRQAAARRAREEERMRLLVRYEGILAGSIVSDAPLSSTTSGAGSPGINGDGGDENRGVKLLAGADRFIVVADVQKRRIDEIVNMSDKGAFVSGVALAGARWDRAGLELRRARAEETFDILPPLLIRVLKPEDYRPPRFTAALPMYRTAQRGAAQHVMDIAVRITSRDIASSPAKWVLNGAFLNLDEVEMEK